MKMLIGCLAGILLLITNSGAQQTASQQHLANQYKKLSEQLEVYNALADGENWIRLPEGTCLQLRDSGELVLQLRQNLLLTHDLTNQHTDSANAFFDETLKKGVQRFQQRHGLIADGIVGQQTLEELRIMPAYRAKQIALNMERWQAFNAKAYQRSVLVNIPDYTLHLLDNEKSIVWETRVIVGLATKGYRTIQMDQRITHIVLNPSWNIPKSIIRREIIPIMKKDPGYLARNHMRVYHTSNTKSTRIPSGSINWHLADPDRDHFQIIQDPGTWNALGKMKFIFPNRFSIYMHDTPAKMLFNQQHRAYSHGCIRVQHPEKLATYLLSTNWKKPKDIKPYLKDKSPDKVIRLPESVPISIGYFTSWVNEAGELQFRKDIYRLDVVSISKDLTNKQALIHPEPSK